MYESRCYEKSTWVEANGKVMGQAKKRFHCFHQMKCFKNTNTD